MDMMDMDDKPVSVRAGYFNVLNVMALFLSPGLYGHEGLTLRELEALMRSAEDYVLLDVRAEAKFKEGHIQGALNLPVGAIELVSRRIIARETTVVLYGRGPGCAESAVAADKLKTIGFEKVLRFAGGLQEWAGAGNRIVKTDSAGAFEGSFKYTNPEAA